MSKFIVIFCVAVFVSATHAASIEKPKTLLEMKKECILGITETFEKFKDTLYDMASASKTEEGRSLYDDGVILVDNLIKQVWEAESIEQTKEPVTIFVPVKCSQEVSDALIKFVWGSMEVGGLV